VAVVHDRAWEEDGRHLLALQERVNGCLDYIEGGQMDEEYPESVGKPRRVVVFHAEPPDAITTQFFSRVDAALNERQLHFAAEPLDAAPGVANPS